MHSILSLSIAFLFLVQAMMPKMDLCCELSKFPTLFEHYEEHFEHDGTTLTQFLDFHYGIGKKATDHHHGDNHDSELPLHGQHQCNHGYVFIGTLFVQMNPITPHSFTQKSYRFSISTGYLDSPFQPPQA